jgi:hypothetical protein
MRTVGRPRFASIWFMGSASKAAGVFAAVCAAARWLRATPYLCAASAAPGRSAAGSGSALAGA